MGNPTAGPRPITIEQYRARQGRRQEVQTVREERPPKVRTGEEAKFRARIGEANRLFHLAVGAAERERIRRDIRQIHQERREYRNKKRQAGGRARSNKRTKKNNCKINIKDRK